MRKKRITRESKDNGCDEKEALFFKKKTSLKIQNYFKIWSSIFNIFKSFLCPFIIFPYLEKFQDFFFFFLQLYSGFLILYDLSELLFSVFNLFCSNYVCICFLFKSFRFFHLVLISRLFINHQKSSDIKSFLLVCFWRKPHLFLRCQQIF